MRTVDIELWVQRVALQIERQQHAEDALVELKAQWPDVVDAARGIAGHANAAHGEPILWIIGLDEKVGARGADPQELSNWFAALKKCFDGIYPELRDVNVSVGGKVVVALVFKTDRAPYVVRNAMFGKPGAGAVEWEVPWREARSTRTARREHLLRLLAPLTPMPELEILSAELLVREEWLDDASSVWQWYLTGSLYVVPRPGSPVVYPFHRCSVSVTLGDEPPVVDWPHLLLSTHASGARTGPVEVGPSEVTVLRPGTVTLNIARKASPRTNLPWPINVTCTLRLPPVGAMEASNISFHMARADAGNDFLARWMLSAA